MMLWEVQGNRGQEHDEWVLSEMKETPTVGGMGKQEGSGGGSKGMVQPRTVNLDAATGLSVGKEEVSEFPLWLAIDI